MRGQMNEGGPKKKEAKGQDCRADVFVCFDPANQMHRGEEEVGAAERGGVSTRRVMIGP